MIRLFVVLIQTLFIGLKLMHEIDWSWWLVFTPLITLGALWFLVAMGTIWYLAWLDKKMKQTRGW